MSNEGIISALVLTDRRPVPDRPEGVASVDWRGRTFPPKFDFERDTWNGERWGQAFVGEPRPNVPYPVRWRERP